MGHEAISKIEIDIVIATLQAEHGVIIFRKRELAIPILKRESLVAIVGEKNADFAMQATRGVYNYLEGIPAGDQFGSDDNKRRRWRDERREELGEVFDIAYTRRNQFRINVMFAAILGIELLQSLAVKNQKIEVANSLQRISYEWCLRIDGIDPKTRQHSPSYGLMESIEAKLEVVRFGEDECLEALKILSSQTPTRYIGKL